MEQPSPRIELLWWEGCPSADRAEHELRAALDELALGGAEVERREIAGEDHAHAERFIGSPTIRVDGEDVIPPPAGEPYGLACRIYRLRDGRISPTPDPADLRAALARVLPDTTATIRS